MVYKKSPEFSGLFLYKWVWEDHSILCNLLFMSSPKTSKKRFFIIDGYALLFRAHFALIRNPLFTSYGLNSRAKQIQYPKKEKLKKMKIQSTLHVPLTQKVKPSATKCMKNTKQIAHPCQMNYSSNCHIYGKS